MRLARDLPVYSPLSGPAIVAGLRALIGTGDESVSRLEELIRAQYAPADLLLTDSGTSALALALTASARSPESPGAEALAALPAYGCFDLATAADAAGIQVVLYDLDPETLGPDWPSLERVLAAGATCVVVAHLYGLPVDMRRVRSLCRGRAHVIEDAAQAAGATIEKRPAGSLGSLGVLSFGRGKGRTGGGGGALLANDPAGDALLESVRALLRPPLRGGRKLISLLAQWMLARPRIYGVPASLPFLGLGETVYRQAWMAEKCPPLCAAVLAAEWSATDAEVTIRRANAERLTLAALGNGALRIPRLEEEGIPSYLRFPVLASDHALEGARSLASLGVMPGYPAALCDLPGFSGRCRDIGDSYAGARVLASSLVTLPVHSRLLAGTLGRLEEWLAGTLEPVTPGPVGAAGQ